MANISPLSLMRLMGTQMPSDCLFEILESLRGSPLYIPALRIASNCQLLTTPFLKHVFESGDVVAIANVLYRKGYTAEYFPQMRDFPVEDWIWILSRGIGIPEGILSKYPNLAKAWEVLELNNKEEGDE